MKVILLTYANDEYSSLSKLKNEIESIDKYLTHFIEDGIATPQAKELLDVEPLLDFIDDYKNNLSIILFSGHASSQSIRSKRGHEAFGEGLAQKLNIKECPNLKLVFLNGCATKGMVSQLLDNGVPVVIYTYSLVEDAKAAAFSTAFFKALSKDDTIEKAFGKAKANIDTLTNGNVNISDRGNLSKSKDEIETLKIDDCNWGCIHTDGSIFREWTIASNNDESIRLEDFENLVRTEKNTPEYKRLEILRQILTDLETNKRDIKNDPDQISDIESLCLHIENEIKNIKILHDIKPEDLYTTNKKVRYSLKNSIGFGRYSDIFRAIRIEGNNRKDVAFKVLKMHSNSELELLKGKIYHLKTLPDGHHLVKTIIDSFGTKFPYYVTEYVDKSNLRNFIIEQKLNGNERLELIKKVLNPVCDALHYLHDKEKYAHMDVRPSNIVIKTIHKEIKDVVLIDLDDYVTSNDNKHKSHLKSSPYLDDQIREDYKNKKFDINNCYQADIYAITLVFIFCIVKEDLMSQSMVKKLREKEGLINYINELPISEDVKSFLKKGTRTAGSKFENISEFKEHFNNIKSIELPKPPEPNFFQKNMNKILWAFGIITVLLLIALMILYNLEISKSKALKKTAEEKDIAIEEKDALQKKLFQLQGWHLQVPFDSIKEQISYIDSNGSDFLKTVENIVSQIRNQDTQNTPSNEPLNSNVVTDTNFYARLMNSRSLKYNGMNGDDTTRYFPQYGRVSISNTAKKINNPEYFSPSAKRIINTFTKYMIDNSKKNWENEKDTMKLKRFLNTYLIGEKNIDSLHIITLIYLGYDGELGKNGQKTSFMLRYPAYNVRIKRDKKTDKEIRYELIERPWWREATDVANKNNSHGLTKPYVDSRADMPQPRTFWYRIELANPKATAVLGIDFVFEPIKKIK